ncbi:hypothetical protein DL96DRAFT_1499391 [Flagelloscypha sp. PMI_526]|nr:hypothetical protein DL96DRAFT_1499391 [Flagelloscypha sp. PMI_526]
MTILDHIKDGLNKIPVGKSSNKIPPAGISNSGGHVMHQEDMIVPKRVIVLHGAQVFFNFLAMCCMASVASFQAKYHVGPSGLTGFSLFITIIGIFLSAFMLLIPVLYDKYDKFVNLAQALKEVRVSFILTGIGTTFSLLIAFIVTISAFTQAGCKDAKNDPHAKEGGDDFVKGLPSWCSTKKAGAVFMWLAFGVWLASLVLLIIQWRQGKLHHGPRDPPFRPPTGVTGHEEDDDDLEASYTHVRPARQETEPKYSTEYSDPHSPNHHAGYNDNNPASPFADQNRYSGRPSMDTYGAFSDPVPSGYGSGPPPSLPEPDLGPQVSRTMQYANDPYAAIQSNIQRGGSHTPPGYDYPGGYR